MSLRDHLIKSAPPLSTEWRAEAITRLFVGLGTASCDNGTQHRDCLVPVETINASTGEILPEKNNYRSVMITGQKTPAHTAVLMLARNRHPIRGHGANFDEVGMHLCNNPACRKLAHLDLGTRQDDSDYKVRCHRAPSGPQNGHTTKPEKTPRGNLMSHTKLREPMRTEVISLIKKYHAQRGFATAIAEHAKITRNIVYRLKKDGAHLQPSVLATDIVLKLEKWKRRAEPVEKQPIEPIIREMRQRFLDSPIAERSVLLVRFEVEYGRSDVWIRKVLNQTIYKNSTLDIPIPLNFGIGRRRRKKADPQFELPL